MKRSFAVEDLLDITSRYAPNGTTIEAVALAEIAERLAGIDNSLHEIVAALQDGTPWNVKLT